MEGKIIPDMRMAKTTDLRIFLEFIIHWKLFINTLLYEKKPLGLHTLYAGGYVDFRLLL